MSLNPGLPYDMRLVMFVRRWTSLVIKKIYNWVYLLLGSRSSRPLTMTSNSSYLTELENALTEVVGYGGIKEFEKPKPSSAGKVEARATVTLVEGSVCTVFCDCRGFRVSAFRCGFVGQLTRSRHKVKEDKIFEALPGLFDSISPAHPQRYFGSFSSKLLASQKGQ